MRKYGGTPRIYALYVAAVRLVDDTLNDAREEARWLVESAFTLGLFAHFEGALMRDFETRRQLVQRADHDDPRAIDLLEHFDRAQSLRDRSGGSRENVELRLDAYELAYRDEFAARRVRSAIRRALKFRNLAAHGLMHPRHEHDLHFVEAANAIENWFACIPDFPLDAYDRTD
ncbi:MAG: hypothetical protein AB7K09_21800 [Planctomycetota bacterium]